MYGLAANALQSEITIEDSSITGTLNHVSNYTQFSGQAEEQSGNYLALSLSAADGVTIETEVVNGSHGPVIVDDGFCVYRIVDNTKQKIRVTATKGSVSKTTLYSLTGLTCNKQ